MRLSFTRFVALLLLPVFGVGPLVSAQVVDQDQSSITALSGGGSTSSIGDANRSPAQAIVLDDITFDVELDRMCVNVVSSGVPFSCEVAAINLNSAQDICTWAEDYTMNNVSGVGTDQIDLDQDLTGSPSISIIDVGGEDVVGNAWAFLERNGQWIGGTWEFMRPGQRVKFIDNIITEFNPVPGQEVYYMVSTLGRSPFDGSQNGRFRTDFFPRIWMEGTTSEASCVVASNPLVDISFEGESEATLAFDYTGTTITATGGTGTVENIIQGESQLLFDVEGADTDVVTVTISGLRAYILDGRADDVERLRITFNDQDYFTDRFTVDTFSEFCTDVTGTFAGATGISNAFKAGDQLSYFVNQPNVGQQYFIDLSSIGLSPRLPVGEAVTIPQGSVDSDLMTFPLIEQRLSTGEFITVCMTSPITIDNELSVFSEFGSFSGETGASSTFRIGDNILYTAPSQIDNDTFTIDYNVIAGSETNPAGSFYTIPEGNVDVSDSGFLVTATDDAGNQVQFATPGVSLDNIRPVYPNDFLSTGPFVSLAIPQSKLDDLRYRGFVDLFEVEKDWWGDGDTMTILLPTDDTTDNGDPLVSADFTDISSAGTLINTRDPAETTFTLDRYFDTVYADVSEIATFIDQVDYTNTVRYTDDAGNDPVEGATTTNGVAIDLVGPQIPTTPEYGFLQMVEPRPVAIIGDFLELIVPELDIQGDVIRYSADLREVGGDLADLLFQVGTQGFTVRAGSLEVGEAYNTTIHYFDKAFNLIERTFGDVLVDNEIPMFDPACGATFTITQSEGDENGLADAAYLGPDTAVFQAPLNNGTTACDLTSFSVDFSPISGNPADNYVLVPADGRQISVLVGEGDLDGLNKSFVMTTFDQNGNQEEYLTSAFPIDNQLAQPSQIDDFTEFADFNSPQADIYIGLGDRIRINLRTNIADVAAVRASLPGVIATTPLVRQIDDEDLWIGTTAVIEEGDLSQALRFIDFTIIDDALNTVVIPGKQKVFVTNKVPSNDFGGGGSIDHNRSSIDARREGREGIAIRSIADQARVHDALNQAEKYTKRIEFLQKHGFELGPNEKAFMRERSLSRRLNYIQPSAQPGKRDNLAPSYFDLMKEKFRISREKITTEDKTPSRLRQSLLDRLLPTRRQSKLKESIDDEGGFRIQNTMDRLKSSAKKGTSTVPGTLRKSEILRRGKVGEIKY